MNKAFDIFIYIMGDVKAKIAHVTQSEDSNIFNITLPNYHKIAIKFSDNGELVQTTGTPLDSNTLHSISEAIKNG